MASQKTITTAGDLANAMRNSSVPAVHFDIQAAVSCVLCSKPGHVFLAFHDESGQAWANGPCPTDPPLIQPGDIVRLVGHLRCGKPAHTANAHFTSVEVLRHETPILPKKASIAEIAEGALDWQYLQVEGLVRDVFLSETSPTFSIMILADGPNLQRIHVPIGKTTLEKLTALVGLRARICGYPNLNANSFRSYVGREFHCPGIESIQKVESGATDPFDVPPMESLLAKTTAQIAGSGRVKAKGSVLCIWEKDHALVQTDYDDVFTIHCASDNLPRRGDFIEASGLPLSDNFHITLTHVSWRPCRPFPTEERPPTIITNFVWLTMSRSSDKARLHGRAVKFKGRVRTIPDSKVCKDTFLLEDGASIIPVNVSSLETHHWHVEPGSEVEITGIYVMVAEYGHVGFPFSKASGFQIVLSNPSDLKILRTPPWWTVGRMLAVIGTLLAALIAIFIWNVDLRRLAIRKGRELFREQVGHVKAYLRTEERTRLAVELHDTLAQNLTGVSMEIEAAYDLRGNAPKPMLDHLGIAAKALKSCSDELRNCLWDLRSQALEEPDMTKAVLRTLQPHVNDSQLAVRFNVPRERLSDNTTHALLRVIRELVVNAIRHGNASTIKVAGTIDNGELLCSVTDNGSGFDVRSAPGVLQGHFGLQGTRERIDEIGGTFEITSAPGRGTKAVITLSAHTPTKVGV